MNIAIWKGISIGTMFVVTLTFTILPLWIFRKSKDRLAGSKSRRVLSFSNCVSGGVFMAVCYVMLTPYVREKFEDLFRAANIQVDYPVTEVVIVCGFFMVLPVEHLIHSCQTHTKKTSRPIHELASMSTDSLSDSDPEANHTECEKLITHSKPVTTSEPTEDTANAHTHIDMDHASHGHCHTQGIDLSNGLSLQSIVMILALSTHSLFEGLAVGLQTEESKLLHLYVAIIAHEVLVAFAVGINLTKQNTGIGTVMKLALLFSLVIPVGICLGMALAETESIAGKAVSATLQGLAAGTFLYVVFLDIVPAELNSHEDRLFKVLFMFLGFSVAAGLTYWLK